jgi:very-short-patch-repair endonuclease
LINWNCESIIKMIEDDLILIAIMNNGRDLHLAKTEHWYRIPVKSAPKRLMEMRYIAFYLTKPFKDQKWSIPYWSEIKGIKIVKRSELLLKEADHPRANEEYYKIEIGELKQLSNPITSKKGHRTAFIPTTIRKFRTAKEINDLFNESPLEDKLWDEFKKKGIDAERQYYVAEGKSHYLLDFAVFCKEGSIDTECDGDSWHSQPDRIVSDNERDNFLTSKGWSVLRFSSKQINEEMPYCIDIIKHTAIKLGGPVIMDTGLEDQTIWSGIQLDLFDD